MIKNSEKFEKVKMEFIEVSGRRVFRAVLDDYRMENFEALLERAGTMIRNEAPGSVLCLTGVNDMTPLFTNKELFASYLRKNKPFIKASAIYGVPRIFVPILNTIDHFSGRSDIMVFNCEEDAVNWLVSR
jgi:hypothetical protein